jgi:hypothetical protein
LVGVKVEQAASEVIGIEIAGLVGEMMGAMNLHSIDTPIKLLYNIRGVRCKWSELCILICLRSEGGSAYG